MNWNPSPTIFEIGPIALRWYGFLFAFGFYLNMRVIRKMFLLEGYKEIDVSKLLTYTVIGTLVGARVGHCFFYDPAYYLQHPLEVLMIWKGGLASHGAVIGVMVSTYLYSSKYLKVPFLWTADRACATNLITAFLIRVGNFMNSEIIGTETDVPWAVTFTKVDYLPRHPAQLYEAFSYLALFFIFKALYYRKKEFTPRGSIFGLWLVSVFTVRFFIEFVKKEQVDFEKELVLNMGQILSIPLVILGIVLFIRAKSPTAEEVKAMRPKSASKKRKNR